LVTDHVSRINWTRSYTYNEPSLIKPAKKSNRLSERALQTNSGSPAEQYFYDAHCNIRQMPHLLLMRDHARDPTLQHRGFPSDPVLQYFSTNSRKSLVGPNPLDLPGETVN
jgi:hypothetical protein